MKQGIIYTLIAIALIALSFLIGRTTAKEPISEPQEVKVDTLLIRDTLRPQPEVIERHMVDSIFVPVSADTVIRNDTVYITLPRTQIIASGENFKAWISGYEPRLDGIEVYPETKIITRTVEAPFHRWNLSAQVGYGNTFESGGINGNPYANIRLGYQSPAKRWSFGVEGGYGASVLNGALSASPFIEFYAEFEIFSW